jgi:hydroxymethylbilane synthase
LIAPLHHGPTAEQVTAERALNARLNGGCQVPIAGHAVHRDGELFLRGLVGMPDGSRLMRSEMSGPMSEAARIGRGVGESLLAQGADQVLAALAHEPAELSVDQTADPAPSQTSGSAPET